MYHYTDSGLDNVWLVNGYAEVETPYGVGVSIDNMDGLHLAIGQWLVKQPNSLSPDAFRFLRLEMDISQRRIADLFDTNEQNIGRWERGETKIHGPADRLIRILYSEFVNRDDRATKIVTLLAELDKCDVANLKLKETAGSWDIAA